MHCTLCAFYRKKIFSGVRHFAHANLSAALLLGLIIFIGGVEHASSSKVSPKNTSLYSFVAEYFMLFIFNGI